MAFGKGFSSAKALCLPVPVLESVFSVSLLWSEWMCSPKLIYWNPNHLGGDIRRWLGQEGGVLMHGISALIRVPTGPPATFARWGHSENMTICEAGSEPSADSKPASTLILSFSASRTMRNKYLLFVSHPSYGIFVTATWTDLHRWPALSSGFSVLLSLLLFYFLLSCSFSSAFPFLLSLYLLCFSLSLLLLFIHYIFKENINLKLCPCWSSERWIKEHNVLKPNCPRSLSLSVSPHPLQKMHHLLKNRKSPSNFTF